MTSDPVGDLQRAATLMREQHGPDHVRYRFWRHLADWLETVASLMEHGDPGGPLLQQHAISTARAYLDAP